MRNPTIARYRRAPMVDWQALTMGADDNRLRDLCDELDGTIVHAARLRAYLASAERGEDHSHRVKASNTLGRKIRRALGYSYPGAADVSF